ncbi:hypothetical protein IE81DRAFT_348850 [Ceraceosorus guamensis]|uniref:Uncharacterized protein n=1 Tax=Ceraceosorus guamensis TaxID=1522189 RepID=A0A316VTS5_9BASI|nr:hypothetical protein IE81DRAFT_348850 [Ceraceosorus guamensis]PWN40902.1 hypothetical protein IE81DRAFT_348850 [Ceraceosorus guamensis]
MSAEQMHPAFLALADSEQEQGSSPELWFETRQQQTIGGRKSLGDWLSAGEVQNHALGQQSAAAESVDLTTNCLLSESWINGSNSKEGTYFFSAARQHNLPRIVSANHGRVLPNNQPDAVYPQQASHQPLLL